MITIKRLEFGTLVEVEKFVKTHNLQDYEGCKVIVKSENNSGIGFTGAVIPPLRSSKSS